MRDVFSDGLRNDANLLSASYFPAQKCLTNAFVFS